jgi:hypothetical protein
VPNPAFVAGPPSPLEPKLPLPATVVMTPAEFTFRTAGAGVLARI